MIHNGFKSARPLARLRAGRSDWYRIENKADSPTEIYIYDEIGYVGVSAKDFVQDLNKIKDSEIIIHLDTPGGDVYDGINIYNAIRDHRAEITMIVDSVAASAGSFILQAGDKRVMNRNSEVMIHDAHSLAIGNATDLTEFAERLDKISNNIAMIYADRGGKDADHWRELMRSETWFSADEAVEAGLADEVVGREAKAKNDFDLSVFSYAGQEQAPAPVISNTEVKPEEIPQPDIDWAQFADALKGAFA